MTKSGWGFARDSLSLQKLLLLLSVRVDQLLGNQLDQFQTFFDLHQHLKVFPTSNLSEGETRGDCLDFQRKQFYREPSPALPPFGTIGLRRWLERLSTGDEIIRNELRSP